VKDNSRKLFARARARQESYKSDRPEGVLVSCVPTAPGVVFVCLKVSVG